LDIQKLKGFSRIYQAECFPDEVKAIFGKSTGEMKRYLKWLYTWLSVLDLEGMSALNLEQFEYLIDTKNPNLYAIRHPHSQINERYIYFYADDESVILLTAFKEKNTTDYNSAIARAKYVYAQLEDEDNED
jgi:phage-related protein